MIKNTLYIIAFSFILHTSYFILPPPTHAIVDPLAVPNNKYGIHIISAVPEEINPAAELVNSSGGDWGYVTVIVESKNRDADRWQKFFNELRRKHLIPIVRLATNPDGGTWKRPYSGEEEAWAGFLDNLIWPTKNRYVVVYNEPNHGAEWGGEVDGADYAKTLNKTIDALKQHSEDFFILNAGFDTSAPSEALNYEDQVKYMEQMEVAVPGIFNKLDGWSSHSYPQPNFTGSPNGSGRGSVRTWFWELQVLRNLRVSKNLPVFITETGWKHSEGVSRDTTLPNPGIVSEYFETAFKGAWESNRVVAVTLFLLNYQDPPFDHFSFKKITGEGQNQKILGAQYPEYYDHYDKIVSLSKLTGYPVQENKARLTKGEIYKSLVAKQDYVIPITFKNTGQSIWNEAGIVKLLATEGGKQLNIQTAEVAKNTRVEPGQDYTFYIKLKAPEGGTYKVKLVLQNGNKVFDNDPWEFYTEMKTPVILKIKAKLKWKKNFKGDYILGVKGAAGNTEKSIALSDKGLSEDLEARYLLPGYNFEFTLKKPYYKEVTIERPVDSGQNTLDFGALEPDLGSAILNPVQLWKLLPISH